MSPWVFDDNDLDRGVNLPLAGSDGQSSGWQHPGAWVVDPRNHRDSLGLAGGEFINLEGSVVDSSAIMVIVEKKCLFTRILARPPKDFLNLHVRRYFDAMVGDGERRSMNA